MPIGSLPILIAASPAFVAMLLVPLLGGGALPTAVAQTAAYISYQAAEPKTAATRQEYRVSRRAAPSAVRPLALARRAARAAFGAHRTGRDSALFSLFLPFPNAPRAP